MGDLLAPVARILRKWRWSRSHNKEIQTLPEFQRERAEIPIHRRCRRCYCAECPTSGMSASIPHSYFLAETIDFRRRIPGCPEKRLTKRSDDDRMLSSPGRDVQWKFGASWERGRLARPGSAGVPPAAGETWRDEEAAPRALPGLVGCCRPLPAVRPPAM